MSYIRLIAKINTHVRLTFEDKNAIKRVFKPYNFSKNTIVQKEFTIPKYLYFILSGYMRLHYLNDNGDEVTTRISKPDEFITPFPQKLRQLVLTIHLSIFQQFQMLRRYKDHNFIDHRQIKRV